MRSFQNPWKSLFVLNATVVVVSACCFVGTGCTATDPVDVDNVDQDQDVDPDPDVTDGDPDIVNGNDLCPLDPAKDAPGVCGCGVPDDDSDADGTLDCNDQCPADPLKITAGDCGCGQAELDGDGDGTADCIDGCPNDSNKQAPGLCGCGEIDLDSNNDGFCDSPMLTANDGVAMTVQDSAVILTLTGFDPEGDDLSFVVQNGPANGTLGAIDNSAVSTATVTYTPTPGFSGTDQISFFVNDGATNSNIATLTITVSAAGVMVIPEFSSFLGGNDKDTIRDVFVDDDGFIYIAGGTRSSNFPTTAGAHDQTLDASGSLVHDVHVAKLNSDGSVAWSTYLGGPNYDRAYAIEVDASGNVYIAGRAGDGFPTTPGVLQTSFAGDVDPNSLYGEQDGFVAKLSSNGDVLWATYFGDPDRSFVRDLDIDTSGNVYVALTANSIGQNPHITAGAFQTSHAGGRDGVVAKISANGTQVLWGSYLGGSGNDLGTPSIRVDASGQAHVIGFTSSSNLPTTTGAFDTSYGGGGDVHLTKFSADGSQILYSTYIGGSAVEFTETHGLALDSNGNAYVAATTSSTNMPVTAGAYQGTYGGSGGSGTGQFTNYPGDGFVAKFSVNGSTLLACTYLGGRFGEGIEGVAILPSGEVFVGGSTFSDDFPVSSDAYQSSGGANGDFFGALLSNDLSTLVYATYVGGSALDYGRSATTDSDGTFYLVGQTESNNWPVLNAVQSGRGGAVDGAIIKIVR